MKGRCNHCDVEYPVADLAGYNVRYGQITRALCNSCVSILGVCEGTGWFENLQDRIHRLKRNVGPSTDRTKWEQTKLDVLMNSTEEA